MRSGIVWLNLLLAAAGCDKVFRFQENPPPVDAMIDASMACFVLGPGNADDDGDGQLNKDDVCPRVPNQTTFNEDGDAVIDSCDPCPALVEAGADDDCDDIGAACDPQAMTVNIRDFYGMNDDSGFSSNDRVFVENGEARISATNANESGGFLIDGGTLPAFFEATARIEDGALDASWTYHLVIDGASTVHRIEVRYTNPGLRLVIEREPPRAVIDSITLPSVASSAPLTIKLRAEITATSIKASATVNGETRDVAIDTAELANLALPSTYRHGLTFYRDPVPVPATTSSYTQYYSITRPMP